MKSTHPLQRLSVLLLGLAALTACGPAPNTNPSPTPSPSATATATAEPSPSATATAEPTPTAMATPITVGTPYPSTTPAPSVYPSQPPTPEPSPMPSATATASATSTPTASASATPEPTPTPEVDIHELRENFFKNYGINPFVEATTDPLSTFAVDVDTASYTIARNYINSSQLPPPAAVRTEEFLNYFDYHYPQPVSGKFAIHTDLAPSFFGDTATRLMRVGIQGLEVLDKDRKQANLTFVIDVSGSMNQVNRLELVKKSLRLLLEQLNPNDMVGIVIYGNEARVVQEPTSVSNKALITSIINNLRPEGSTNAEAGLLLGYEQAGKAFRAGAINRVILCSDGVANVGATGPDAILERIDRESEKGITLTALGFGMGEYNDTLMEQLANKGDGNYAYIDSFEEAEKVLHEQITSTLQVIAKDAKIQVAFNPDLIEQYRLLGYENRNVADEDFRNDSIDAGEIGSNHSVTALYEVRFKPDASDGNIATVTLRFKDVDDADRIKEISRSVSTDDLKSFSSTSGSFRLATSVAEYAEILRNSIFAQGGKLSEVVELVRTAQNAYPDDKRIEEFATLAQKAAQLQRPVTVQSLDSIVGSSKNPQGLPSWEGFLLKQLGGRSSQ